MPQPAPRQALPHRLEPDRGPVQTGHGPGASGRQGPHACRIGISGGHRSTRNQDVDLLARECETDAPTAFRMPPPHRSSSSAQRSSMATWSSNSRARVASALKSRLELPLARIQSVAADPAAVCGGWATLEQARGGTPRRVMAGDLLPAWPASLLGRERPCPNHRHRHRERKLRPAGRPGDRAGCCRRTDRAPGRPRAHRSRCPAAAWPWGLVILFPVLAALLVSATLSVPAVYFGKVLRQGIRGAPAPPPEPGFAARRLD